MKTAADLFNKYASIVDKKHGFRNVKLRDLEKILFADRQQIISKIDEMIKRINEYNEKLNKIIAIDELESHHLNLRSRQKFGELKALTELKQFMEDKK